METIINIENTDDSARNRWLTATFLIWILLIDFLFFEEYMGLNAFIAAIITIPIFGYKNQHLLKDPKWWIAALIWLLTAFGVFMKGTFIAGFFYFLSVFLFAALSHNLKLSAPIGMLNSLVSFATGFFHLPGRMINFFQKPNSNKNKWLLNFLLISIPLSVIIIFLKLYQSADVQFYELTKFINLDWVSWGFLVTYLILSFSLYGFFYYESQQTLIYIEEKAKNDIRSTYSDKIQKYFGVKNETKIAFAILIALNAMLILYNVIDINYILTDYHSNVFSESVHDGVYALITSIVLVILLTTYLFRGKLNFQGSKMLRLTILIWLFQNGLMVITTMIKNYGYVEVYGLTHKRIGVFVYLILALVGIGLTIYKIYAKKTFWWLVRQGTLSFALLMAMLQTFNWHRFIADFNLHNVKEEIIEYEYLMNLGPDTYPFILEHEKETAKVPNEILIRIRDQSDYPRWNYIDYAKEDFSWKSMNLSDYWYSHEMAQYEFKTE